MNNVTISRKITTDNLVGIPQSMTSPGETNLDIRLRKTQIDGFELDVALAVGPGITILFWASGAGKTSLLDCIAGLTTPDSGGVMVAGRTVFDSERGIDLPVRDRRIGYVFQDLALFPHLSVEENV